MTRLTFVGDIACDRPLLKAAKHGKNYDFSRVFQTQGVFQNSDLVIGNLESCFGGANYGKKPYHYSVPDSFGDAIRDAGFDLVSTANNHCLDEGLEGLERTIKVLDRLDIAHTGTFAQEEGKRWLTKEINGVSVAFYSLTYSVNSTYEASLCDDVWKHVNIIQYRKKRYSKYAIKRVWQTSLKPGLQKIYLRKKAGTIIPMRTDKLTPKSINEEYLTQIDKHLADAKREADILVVLLHIGGQFNTEPGEFSKFMVNHLCEQGVDVIVGHHPHTLQRIETRGKTRIAFSLGGYCLSPSADYLVRESLPEYSAAWHIDIDENKQIADASVQLLKCVEDEDRYVHVVEAEHDSPNAESIRNRLSGLKTPNPDAKSIMYFLYADDFGLRESKTNAIDDAFCKGWIQAAGMIVNTENFEEAASLAEQHGYKDKICFHLNLTDCFPLTEAIRSTALCNKDGSFALLENQKIQRLCMSVQAIRAIREECEAQMKRFRDGGFLSQHIDSHRWRMWNLPVWLAIKPLLKRYGFSTTRTMIGHLSDSSNKKQKKIYRMVLRQMRPVLKSITDWSGCMSEFQEALDCRRINSGTRAEIYVHPELLDGVSTDTYYSYHETRPLAEVIQIADELGVPVGFQ